MIDTGIVLSGEAANEFHNMMISVDVESINARDAFILDSNSRIDEMGILTIDMPELEINLDALREDKHKREIVTKKGELYLDRIQISYTNHVSGRGSYGISNNMAKSISYSVGENGSNMYTASVKENLVIKYAA